LVCLVYFSPAIIGRHKRNSSAILVLNLFLGWTFIGWVLALVWAYTVDTPLQFRIYASASSNICAQTQAQS
jgi:hypothetical protein